MRRASASRRIHIPCRRTSTQVILAIAVIAFLSATHDVAADGFYLAALDDRQQAFFVGIRSTAYRIANVVGRGLLVMLAGGIESAPGDVPAAWRWVYLTLAVCFLVITGYHAVVLWMTSPLTHQVK